MKEPTGIEKLDKILGGGFPRDSSILLIGPPGSGKTTFCQQFLYAGLKKSEPAVYIILDTPPNDISEAMKNFNWDIKPFLKNNKMMFLDAYSWKIGGGKDENWKRVIQGGLDINALNLTLSEIFKKINTKTKRDVFDSVSTLLLYVPSELVVRFVPILIAKARQSKSTQLLVLEEGVHDKGTVNSLNYLVDGTLETKIEGNDRLFRVSRMKGVSCTRDWFKMELTKKGLVMV